MRISKLSNKLIAFILAALLVIPTLVPIPVNAASEQASAAQTSENIQQEMDFLYIESLELEAPGTQNIVISWDENIKSADSLELVYIDGKGNKFTAVESERTDHSVLFSIKFDKNQTGTYTIKGVNYTVGEASGYFEFKDVEIKATFEVVDNESEQPVTDNVVVTEISGSNVNTQGVENQIEGTLRAANVSDAARRAPSGNLVVVLDPGHGSREVGASGNGLQEHVLNYKIALYCKAELETYEGVDVYLTHNGAGFTGSDAERMQARIDFAVSKKADLLVSLHNNATAEGTASGAEVWYPNNHYKPAVQPTGKGVAASIQKELVALGLYDRGIKEKSTVDDKYPDGSTQDWYGIIRRAKLAGIPGIIVEHAYIDNKSDVDRFLSSDAKLQNLGIADATGIAKYFGLYKKAPVVVVPDEATPAEVDIAMKDAGFSYAEYTAPDQETAYIRGFKPAEDISVYIDQLEAVEGIENVVCTDATGEPVTSGNVATGQVITFEMGGKTYTRHVVVAGDVNGDGEIYATDYVKIKNHIMNVGKPLSGAYKCAADTNGDAMIYATDYVKTKNHIMGTRLIDQNLVFKVYDI